MAELTTLARPYARAAFDVAQADGKLDLWAESLTTADAITTDNTIQALLDSPALTAGQKSAAMADVLGDSVDQKFKNFLTALAENKRLVLLPTIRQQFVTLKAEREKTVEVEVTTAYEIPAATQKALVDALTKKLEREVAVSLNVDASLLGGALIRAGDTVIDGSVKGRLSKLAEAVNS